MGTFSLPLLPMLKSSELPWIENEEAGRLVKADPKSLSHEDLVKLVNALDVRLFRLWDKVSFERQHGLVNYAKFQKGYYLKFGSYGATIYNVKTN